MPIKAIMVSIYIHQGIGFAGTFFSGGCGTSDDKTTGGGDE
jgi:hypothetical protein